MKQNNIQSESELTKDGSITNAVMPQHKRIWTAEMEDHPVNLWQQHECLYNVSCKTYLFSNLERFCEISLVHSPHVCGLSHFEDLIRFLKNLLVCTQH